MRVNRFQLALYTGFPFLAAYCSVVMIMHFITWLDGAIDSSHPYSDALIYYEIAENLGFFGDTHITHRIVVPGMAAAIAHGLGISGEGSYGLIFAVLNFAAFFAGVGALFRIAIVNQWISAFQVIIPGYIIALTPAFVRGVFFPMVDAGAFFGVAAILFALFFRRLWLLYAACIFAVFTKEIALLSILAVPLVNTIRKDSWGQAYVPFVVAGGLYLLAAMIFAPSVGGNYLFSPGAWLSDWQASITGWGPEIFRYLLSAFGPALLYIAYKFYANGLQRIYLGTCGIFLALFIIFLLYTPSNAPRLMFMALPLLVFFTYTDEQFRGVFKWVLDPESMPVENQPGEDEVSRRSKLGDNTEISVN